MTKHIQILSAVLAIQILLAIVLLTVDSVGEVEETQLLGVENIAQSDAITISDDQGIIEIYQSNGTWLLRESGLPASTENLNNLLDFISSLRNTWTVSTEPATQNRYKVAESNFVKKMTFQRGEDSLLTLYIGSTLNINKTYVRQASQPEVFTAKVNLAQLSTENSYWLDSKLLAKPNFVGAIGKDFRLTLMVDSTTPNWSVLDNKQKKIENSPRALADFRNAVANLRVKVPSSLSLSEPDFALTLLLKDGITYQYAFYKHLAQKEESDQSAKFYLRSSQYQANFEIAESVYNNFNKKLADFNLTEAEKKQREKQPENLEAVPSPQP